MPFEYQGVKITWYGHASFKISNSAVIYIDPYLVPSDAEKADIVLVTHEHYDHCAVENIKALAKEDTVVVAPENCVSKLEGLNVKPISANESVEVKGVVITATEAYNIDKPFHPKGLGVGYIVEINGVKIYHAGDTDAIEEMRTLNVDIALLPVGGTYTMNAEEAAAIVNEFKPKIAIPMHYGEIVGSELDAQKFKELVKEARVEILEKEA